VVTNVDFEKWGEYLTDGPLAMAFLDRLVERAIILKVYRQIVSRLAGSTGCGGRSCKERFKVKPYRPDLAVFQAC
jgi:hypothetical protein